MDINQQLQAAYSQHQAGNLQQAATLYRQILQQAPDQVDALRLLGLVVATSGNLPGALELMRRAVAVNPAFAAGHASLSLLLGEMGQVDASIVAAEQALKLDPNLVDAYCGLGLGLKRRGELDGAIQNLQKAISLNPQSVVAYSQLGPLLAMRGDFAGAIYCYRSACKLQPNQAEPFMQLAGALRTVQFTQFDQDLKADLVKCFEVEDLNYRDLATAAASLVKLDPGMRPVLASLQTQRCLAPADLEAEWCILALSDPLLLRLMQKTMVPDRELEQLLTAVRRMLLELWGDDPKQLPIGDSRWRDFIVSLAQQCFFNEYIYQQTPMEIDLVDQLRVHLERTETLVDVSDKWCFALYTCYRNPGELPQAQAFASAISHDTDALFQSLLTDSLVNPLAQLALRDEIPSLLTDTDIITGAVQAQYEENPFPRWKTCHKRQPLPLAQELKRLLPHVDVTGVAGLDAPEILVAGCGTGLQAANCSYAYAGARITAIDLSRASLAYALRQSRELGITNIEFLHANILELDQLNKQFDYIESFGVLHHLNDPRRGWEVLTRLLKPGGYMMLGLYSELARRAVVAVREMIAERSYPATPQGMRDCRQELLDMEEPLIRENITSAGATFWTASEVRDLVFHSNEYRYSLPELALTIAELGLEFLGFQLQDPGDAARYREMFPQDPAGLDLGNWHTYEQKYPRTFSNTYQFWLRKP